MARILRPAAPRSKAGWRIVSSQVPPETFRRLETLAVRRPAFRSDLVREAIEAYLERGAA